MSGVWRYALAGGFVVVAVVYAIVGVEPTTWWAVGMLTYAAFCNLAAAQSARLIELQRDLIERLRR